MGTLLPAALLSGPCSRLKSYAVLELERSRFLQVTDAVGSGGAAGGSVDWTCNKCKTPNFGARKMCSRPGCTEVAPVHVLQQLMASRGHSTQASADPLPA